MPDRRWRGPAEVGIPAAAVAPVVADIRVELPTSAVLRTLAAAVGRILPLALVAVGRILPVIQVAEGRILLPILGALRTLPRIVELGGRTLLRMAV